MTDRTDKPTGDARTVLPGQPVRCHQAAPTAPCDLANEEQTMQHDELYRLARGAIDVALGEGKLEEAESEELYRWLRSASDALRLQRLGHHDRDLVEFLGDERDALQVELGTLRAMREASDRAAAENSGPGDPAVIDVLQQRYDERKAQGLTYVEAKILRGALSAALLPAPFGSEDVSRKLTDAERDQLEAAIARVTIQPAECAHEAWEWPMSRCPGCGTEGR